MNFLTIKKVNFLLLILLLVWCLGILYEFIILYFPNTLIFLPFLKYNYSLVCHVDPDKLLTIGDHTTLLCSRCTGIYFGSLASIMLINIGLFININTKVLFISSIPIFIDIILYSLNIYEYSNYVALTTGLLLGSIGFFYIHCSIINLLVKDKGKS